jgi:CRISPR-associated protein Cmr5
MERGPDVAEANKEKTLDQRRAAHAWEVVRNVVKLKKEEAAKFGGQARKLPTRIIASGLGQALAFLKAKNYAPALLVALGDWVLDKRKDPASTKKPPKDTALLEAVIQGDSDFLRRATDEVLAYLQWLNRFAEAENLFAEPESQAEQR